MPIYALDGTEPEFDDRKSNFIAADAVIIGAVRVGRGVSIWFGASVRGDNETITIGAGSNVQEQTIMHTDPGFPLTIGQGCTVGHRALLHGCVIGDNVLIGMGAILLNGAKIGENSLVGAGSLVTEGKTFPPRSLIVGAPARLVRELDDEAVGKLKASANHYAQNGRRFMAGMQEI
jgi:carbonic anhydrase/acetyltransferase-like protein (isoleucine patch superfamily)